MIGLVNGIAVNIPLADNSVHCAVTSPPYWSLRDYGTAQWIGGSAKCDHVYKNARNDADGEFRPGRDEPLKKQYKELCPKCGAIRQDAQLGLEPTPEVYVANMVAVFREVRRVLRDDGVLWLNIGDSYAGGHQTGRNDNGRPSILLHRATSYGKERLNTHP